MNNVEVAVTSETSFYFERININAKIIIFKTL